MTIEKRDYTPEEAQKVWEKMQYIKRVVYGMGIPPESSEYWEDADWLSKYLPEK